MARSDDKTARVSKDEAIKRERARHRKKCAAIRLSAKKQLVRENAKHRVAMAAIRS